MKKGFFSFNNWSLSKKITAVFVVFIVLILVVTASLYQYFKATVEHSVLDSIGNAINTNENTVRSIIARIALASDMICDEKQMYTENNYLPRFFSLVRNYQHNSSGREYIETMEEYNFLITLMDSYAVFLGESQKPYEFAVYVDDSYPLARFLPALQVRNFRENDINIYRSSAMEDSELYEQVFQSANTELVMLGDEENRRICLYKPLICNYVPSGEMVMKAERFGVFFVSFDMAWLANSMTNDNISPYAEVFLLNEHNQVVYSTEPENDFSLLQEILDGEYRDIGDARTVAYNGKQCVVQYSTVADNVSMITLVPIRDITNMVNHTINVILRMVLVIILCGLLIAFVLARYVLRPIKRLSRHMEAGDLNKIESAGMGTDEIGKLYRDFNLLIEKINQLFRDIRREADERSKAELRVLQAQINPHFVYNTLDTVCGLSLLHGDGKTADILTSLSHIMRYNTKHPDELVPLSREIEIIRKYELIQSSCYEDDLSFRYDLDPETMSVFVPKLLIQPLVENAILHGMDVKTRQIEVTVISKRLDDRLIIDVIDNGRDAPIDRMNSMLTDKNPDEKSDGLGIRNVYERLKGIYHENGNLVFLKNESGNTIARIEVRAFNGITGEVRQM